MFFSVPSIILGLLLLAFRAAADQVPNLPYDPNTWPGCTYWYDNYGDMTCLETVDHYLMKLDNMIKWNPRLSSDGTNCVGWTLYLSYCVDAFVAPPEPTTTSTSTTTAAPTTTTRPRPAPTWVARGCYLDEDEVVPTIANRTSVAGGAGATTPERCGAACWAAGRVFAGLKRGDECWCGDSIRNEKPLPDDSATACAQPCAGDAARTCGGDQRIDVYEGRPASGPASAPPATATADARPSFAGTTQGVPAMPAPTAASHAARNVPPVLGWLA